MTLEDDLRDSLVGRVIEEVKVDDRTGLAVVRCTPADADDDDAFFCFEAESFADAASIWPELP